MTWRDLTLGAMVLSCAVLAADAQTRTFDGNNDADGGDGTTYTDPLNWDGDDVPNSGGENAVIDAGDAWNVLLNGSIKIGNLTIGGDDMLTIGNGGLLGINGLTADGTVLIDSTGSVTQLRLDVDQTFTGTGEVTLSGVNARLTGNAGGRLLTIDNDFSINGSGNLGVNVLNIVNDGTVQATGNTGFEIDPSTSFTNNGVLQAVGSGGLVFGNGNFINNTSIDVLAGSSLTTKSGTTITGGVINVDPAGTAAFANGTDLNSVTINGTADINNGQSVDVIGGLTVNDTLNLAGTGSLTQLTLINDQTFDGTGEIVMEGAGNNNTRITGNAGGRALTIGNDLTIKGSGNLGFNVLNIVNNGTVRATSNTVPMLIDPSTSFTNNGTLEAVGSAGMVLAAGTFDNQGTFNVQNGSKLETSSGTILKGVVNNLGTGQIILNGGTDLNGVTVNGDADVPNGASVDILNGLTVNNTLTLAGTGSLTQLTLINDQTFDGAGEIVMEGAGNTRITGNAGGRALTIGSDLTIKGSGNLGFNVLNIVNDGTILAQGADPLTIDTSSSFATTGTLGGDGTLVFTDGTVNNQGTISPGLSPGTLTIDGNVDNADTSTLLIEVAGPNAGVDSDLLIVDGVFDVDGILQIRFLPGSEALESFAGSIVIVDAENLLSNGLDAPSIHFDFILVESSGLVDVVVDTDADEIRLTNFRDIVPIPEPASIALFGAAGLLLLGRRRA